MYRVSLIFWWSVLIPVLPAGNICHGNVSFNLPQNYLNFLNMFHSSRFVSHYCYISDPVPKLKWLKKKCKRKTNKIPGEIHRTSLSEHSSCVSHRNQQKHLVCLPCHSSFGDFLSSTERLLGMSHSHFLHPNPNINYFVYLLIQSPIWYLNINTFT